MKEDILEQIVDDWLLSQNATFTKHNIKYKPINSDLDFKATSDAVHSDIDILAVHLDRTGHERVRVITCKAYQGGWNPEHWWKLLTKDRNKIVGGKEAWKYHRELCIPKWGKAFSRKIYEETLSKDFTWTVVITKNGCKNDQEYWFDKFKSEPLFIENLKFDNLSNVKLEIITVSELVKEYHRRIADCLAQNRKSTTVEGTQLGRLLQVLSAADIKITV